MAIETAQYKLAKIYDIREWDPEKREYFTFSEDEMHVCERCHRKHVKVYVVEDKENGELHHVGSGCCQKFLHWEPTKEEVKAANAVLAEKKKTANAHFIQEKAMALVSDVLSSTYGRKGWDFYAMRMDVALYRVEQYRLDKSRSEKILSIARKRIKEASIK